MKPNLKNKKWRMQTAYKIKDKQKRLIHFKRNRAQRDFAENCTNRNIILKSRQLGFTTDESIDCLDDVLFIPNFDALIIAHEKEEALKIFDKKVDLAWKNFKEGLKKLWRVKADRANAIKFAHDREGKIMSSIEVALSGRSGTYHRVHISEFAKICAKYPRKAEEIMTGTIPAVPMSGRIDIESTAEGEDGEFHDLFWEAWNRQGGRSWEKGMQKQPMEWAAFFYDWRWDDEEISQIQEVIEVPTEFRIYQQKNKLSNIEIVLYYQKFIALGKKWHRLRQEYPTTPEEAFVSSGDRLFDPDKTKACEQEYPEKEKIGDWIYLKPYNSRHRYGGGGDTAEGLGGDACAAAIWDFDTNEIVAVYWNNKIDPTNFAYELKDGGNRYGTCLLGIERNNHGHATIAKLKEIYSEEKIFRQRKMKNGEEVETDKFGWHTNLATKPKMMFDLKEAVDQEEVKLPHEVAHEMRLFGQGELNHAKADPEATNHFDILMATAVGWQMRNYAVKTKLKQSSNKRATKISYL